MLQANGKMSIQPLHVTLNNYRSFVNFIVKTLSPESIQEVSDSWKKDFMSFDLSDKKKLKSDLAILLNQSNDRNLADLYVKRIYSESKQDHSMTEANLHNLVFNIVKLLMHTDGHHHQKIDTTVCAYPTVFNPLKNLELFYLDIKRLEFDSKRGMNKHLLERSKTTHSAKGYKAYLDMFLHIFQLQLSSSYYDRAKHKIIRSTCTKSLYYQQGIDSCLASLDALYQYQKDARDEQHRTEIVLVAFSAFIAALFHYEGSYTSAISLILGVSIILFLPILYRFGITLLYLKFSPLYEILRYAQHSTFNKKKSVTYIKMVVIGLTIGMSIFLFISSQNIDAIK